MASRDRASDWSPPPGSFRIGLLGHGTVGAAFAELLEERAEEIERFNGRRPVISGVLTRSRGDFEEILAGADLLVEVIGGIEPAREYLLAAMRAGQGRRDRQQAAALPARRGAVRDRPRARGAAALRGRGRGRRAGRAGARGVAVGDADRAHPRDRQRHDQLHPHRDGAPARATREALAEAQRIGYAEADPSDDVSGRDAAAKMAILARLAFGTPVHLDDVRYEGIEHLHGRRPASTRASWASG